MKNKLTNVRVTKKGNGAIGISPKGATCWFALVDADAFLDSLGVSTSIELVFGGFERAKDSEMIFIKDVASGTAVRRSRPGTTHHGEPVPDSVTVLKGLRYATTRPTVVPLPNIVQLFDRAISQGASRIAFRFEDCGGIKIHLTKKGTLAVTDGGPFGDNRFYGYVVGDEWRPTHSTPKDLVDFIEVFEADPLGYFRDTLEGRIEQALTGQLTSACCFCSRLLETLESISAGYGPVCADKYGLPWGEVSDDSRFASVREKLVRERE
jgi:hypothetical protein